MNIVKNSILEKAERELRRQFEGTNIEFYRRGDGLNDPIYLVVSIPGMTRTADEMIRVAGYLLIAGKAARDFKYNGYFVEY